MKELYSAGILLKKKAKAPNPLSMLKKKIKKEGRIMINSND